MERSNLQSLCDRRRKRIGIRVVAGRRISGPTRLALWWHSPEKPCEIAEDSGGGGRESNPPATILAAKPVLKTGGATGPLPPPSLDLSTLFWRRLRAKVHFANE